MRQSRHAVVQVDRLLAELLHLARRILALESSQIDHAQNEFQRINFRRLLDAAALKPGNALIDANLID
jgi:hypothetical protein